VRCESPVTVPGLTLCDPCRVTQGWRTLRYRYGIGAEDMERLVIAQSGRDPITFEPLTDMCVDHCDACGAVRGLLNAGTNKHLGAMLHSPLALIGLARDLRDMPHVAARRFPARGRRETGQNKAAINTPERAAWAASYLLRHAMSCPACEPQNQTMSNRNQGKAG
jgi:hypothetical protein